MTLSILPTECHHHGSVVPVLHLFWTHMVGTMTGFDGSESAYPCQRGLGRSPHWGTRCYCVIRSKERVFVCREQFLLA